ncbi:hypothetical protein ACFQAT_14910 [Undibacterium arcticum]|uniref:hypothetical protein n=1 Tax=Undibacterium arcticum TaxID=1762892 RepID=UPI00360FB898
MIVSTLPTASMRNGTWRRSTWATTTGTGLGLFLAAALRASPLLSQPAIAVMKVMASDAMRGESKHLFAFFHTGNNAIRLMTALGVYRCMNRYVVMQVLWRIILSSRF